MLRFILLLSFALGLYQTATAEIVRVPSLGGCRVFLSAVDDAATQPVTIMFSRGDGNYISTDTLELNLGGSWPGCEVNVSQGSVTIEGNGATITDEHACSLGLVPMVTVSYGASLTVRNLRIVDGTGACPGVTSYRIRNYGTLSFENVTFIGNGLAQNTFLSSPGSTATFRNTTWIKTGLFGTFDVYNSTFVDSTLTLGPSGMNPALSSHISLTNSLLSSSGQICFQTNGAPLISSGGNVLTDSGCGLSTSTGDKIVSNLNLPAVADHGGLVPTVQIGFGNPAYRAGIAQYCEATDARGVTRNATNCDAGAYESGGGLGLVTANGMNGLYYVPGIANGHYVSVQRIHDNDDVMVFWDTFDSNGNQAWIYGIGTLTSDRHIHASMARNLGGVLQPGGPAAGAKSSAWGTVDIDLTSCSAAQFSYQSSLPEFGSGQFPLTRLAFESAINCGD